VYLPILAEQAAKGSADAVTGIAHIPTTQATAALVKLLSDSDGQFAMKAAWAINDRLPDPPGCEQPCPEPRKTGPTMVTSWPDRRNWLQDADAEPDELRACWDDHLTADVRRFARGLLSDVPAVPTKAVRLHCGAFMLEALATESDIEAIAGAINNVAPKVVAGDPRWLFAEYRHDELTWRKVTARLIGAARTATKRGAALPEHPGTPGRMIQWGLVIRERPTSRPDAWEKEHARLLGADWPCVRETLLRNAPRPLGQPILDGLEGLVGDGDAYVAVAALEAVAECKPDVAKRFRDAVTHVIEKTRDERVLCATPQAAAAVGLPRDQYLHRLVNRLDSPQLYLNAVWQLFDVLNSRPWRCCRVCGLYPKDPAIVQRAQAAWHQFIDANAEAIHAGRRFKPGDPEIVPGMLDGLYLGAYRPGPPGTAPAERE
jgi:hypothetical protein